ncbi:MAG: DUF1587 domain-containing protein, partial [Planctomycetota bacterium]
MDIRPSQSEVTPMCLCICRPRYLCVLLAVTIIALSGRAVADESELTSTPPPITEFLGEHCIDCHSNDEPEAGLSLVGLPFDLRESQAFETWRRVYQRVQDGEMPPNSDLAPNESATFLRSLDRRLMESDSRDVADRGRVRGRRLTRTEYEHTIHSLLGIDLPLRDELPEDGE